MSPVQCAPRHPGTLEHPCCAHLCFGPYELTVMNHLLCQDTPNSLRGDHPRDAGSALPQQMGEDTGVSCQASGGLVSGTWIPPCFDQAGRVPSVSGPLFSPGPLARLCKFPSGLGLRWEGEEVPARRECFTVLSGCAAHTGDRTSPHNPPAHMPAFPGATLTDMPEATLSY